MGEDEAFAYFDGLSKNILQFTASGSGPVNDLMQNEVAVGLGMTAQAVEKINSGADNLKIVYFEEGSPYSLYGDAIISGKDSNVAVKEVFAYLTDTCTKYMNEQQFPEQIFKDSQPQVKNYPTNIKYSDMSQATFAEKERLLAKWVY